MTQFAAFWNYITTKCNRNKVSILFLNLFSRSFKLRLGDLSCSQDQTPFVRSCSSLFFLVLLCSSLLGDDHDGDDDETMMEGSGSLNPLANLFIFQHRSMAGCVINLFGNIIGGIFLMENFGGQFLTDIFGEKFSVGKVRGESLVRYFRWEFFWGNFSGNSVGVYLGGIFSVGKLWWERFGEK